VIVERYRWEGLNLYEKVEFGLEETYIFIRTKRVGYVYRLLGNIS
jgi:hypothetical protein